MARFWVGLTLGLGILAACDDIAGGFRTEDPSPFAPTGKIRSDAVVEDQLLVGHRLMEAGEYELALQSYQLAAFEQGTTAEVLSAIGSANLRLGRLGQAEQQLRNATEQDETFVPAWNNLGVVLMETGNFGEASRVFRVAFALDSGESAEIRNNLALALEKLENPEYSETNDANFALVRQGSGEYLLLSTPE